MSVIKTRTKLGQTISKTPSINPMKSGFLGIDRNSPPSSNPDQNRTETAYHRGFRPIRQKMVGRKSDGKLTGLLLTNDAHSEKFKKNEQKKFAFFRKSVAMYKDMDTSHVPPREGELH